MASFPAAGAIEDSNVTEGSQKTNFEDFLASTKQLLGAQDDESLTISSGSITPTNPSILVDTESAASSDNLDNMLQTNLPAGRIVLIRAADTTHTVVVRDAQGGAGQFLLKGGNFSIDDDEKFLIVKREGTDWVEVMRWFGSDTVAYCAYYGAVQLAGDTMTGLLYLSGDPVYDLNAATKQYVDDTVQYSSGTHATTAGSSNAYTLTLSPVPAAYAAGQMFTFRSDRDNTGAATLNVNSLGAKSIVGYNAGALAAGEIQSGDIYTVVYNATEDNFQLIGPTNAIFGASFESAEITLTASAETTEAHGLGSVPRCRAVLRCKTGEHGYSADDEVAVCYDSRPVGSSFVGFTLFQNATNVGVKFGDDLDIKVIDRSGGGTDGESVSITLGNWKLVIYAEV